MEIEYKSEIIEKCLGILSKPVRRTKDSHSIGYLKARNRISELQEKSLLDSQIDDETYYNELSKDFT